jgi:transcriptional regulator with XRE-family HTH domain
MKKESGRKNLSQYLQLLMKEKGLKLADIERKCQGKLSNSYLSKIIRGKADNLTVEAIDILAQGLGIDGYELFAIAYGKPPRNAGESSSTIDPLLFVEAVQKLVVNPQLIEVIRAWSGLPREHQAELLSSLQSLTKREPKAQKKTRKKR